MTTPSKVYVPEPGTRVRVLERHSSDENKSWCAPGAEFVVRKARDTIRSDLNRAGWLTIFNEDTGEMGAYLRVEPAPTSPAREDRLFEEGCRLCGAMVGMSCCSQCYARYGGTYDAVTAELDRRRSLASQSGGGDWVPAVGDIVNGLGAGSYSRENGDRFEGRVLNFMDHSGFRCVTIATEREGDRGVMIDSLRLIRPAGQRFYGTMPSVLPETLPAGTTYTRSDGSRVTSRSEARHKTGIFGAKYWALWSETTETWVDPKLINWSEVPLPTPAVDAGGAGTITSTTTAGLVGGVIKADPYRAAMIAQCQHLNGDLMRGFCPDCGASSKEVVASRPGTEKRMINYLRWSDEQARVIAIRRASKRWPSPPSPARCALDR